MSKKTIALVVAVVFCMSLVAIPVVSAQGYKKAMKTSAQMLAFKDDIVQGKDQLEVVITELDALVELGDQDLRKQYGAFTSALKKLDSFAKRVNNRSEKMNAHGQKFFDTWESEFKSIENATLRERSESRMKRTKDSYDKIISSMHTASKAYEPLNSNLQDIATYLNVDLNAESIASIKDMVETAGTNGKVVYDALGVVVSEVEWLADAISPKGSK